MIDKELQPYIMQAELGMFTLKTEKISVIVFCSEDEPFFKTCTWTVEYLFNKAEPNAFFQEKRFTTYFEVNKFLKKLQAV